MDFGDAIRALKRGERVSRAGWNGKGMHLYLFDALGITIVEDGDGDSATTPPKLGRPEPAEGRRQYEACIVMFTAQGKHQLGWIASQTDMLAEDWDIAPR